MESPRPPASSEVKPASAARSSGWGKFLGGKLLNLFLWWSFCVMAGTGLLLAWRLPSGSRGGKGLSAMGLGRHDWGDIHTIVGYVFLTLVVLHVALHWRWLWQFAAKKRPWSLLIGVGSGLAVGLFLWWQPVQHSGGPGGKETPKQKQEHRRGE